MPFYRLHLQTHLAPDEVSRRVAAVTRGPLGFGETWGRVFRGPDATPAESFIGDVERDGFSLRRNIRYRNSFLPRIRGRVRADLSGSAVSITMSLHPFVAAFIACWLSMVGFAGVRIASARTLASDDAMLIPLGMFAFGVALALVGFVPEAIKAKRRLMSLLEALPADAARRPAVSS